jgi:hypothetical protein
MEFAIVETLQFGNGTQLGGWVRYSQGGYHITS